MSYVDTTLVPASGYSYVHTKQVYDMIAAQLGAHAGWTFIESVDYVAAPNTTTTYVWRCNSATSGLPANFFVGFSLTFTTIGPVYQTSGLVSMSLFEKYDSSTDTASYPATANSGASIVVTSDNAHPGTWVLSTARPNSGANYWDFRNCNSSNQVTFQRFLNVVSNTNICMNWLVGTSPNQAMSGALETALSAVDDPMPLLLYGNSGLFAAGGSTTRHPKITGAAVSVFGLMAGGIFYYSNSYLAVANTPLLNPVVSGGQLGNSGDSSVNLFTGGTVPVSKCCVAMAHYTYPSPPYTQSTRGGLRGYFKHFLSASTVAHSFGDTFQIEGRVYVAFGSSSYGLMDTQA